ncbi:hypothetical protein ACTTDO_21950, partial [Escherichia coli]
MTNLTLDVNIIDFPSIPVAMLPHRCSPELLNYSVAKFIMWRKETVWVHHILQFLFSFKIYSTGVISASALWGLLLLYSTRYSASF